MAWPEISGRRIAGHRDRLGITQVQLAEHLGIGRSTMQGIENNRNNPSMKAMILLAIKLVGGRVDLLMHADGFSPTEEYNDARYGDPRGPEGRPTRDLVDLWQHPVGMQLDVRGGDHEIRSTVRPLRGPVRSDRDRA